MGGRSYYCDYCCCFIKNDVNVRKTHNSGLIHKMTKLRYMRRFEDPKKVLEEESKKEPCTRFLNGKYCKFDLMCNSTHFNEQQLKQLRKIVEAQERTQSLKTTTTARDDNSVKLPWQRFHNKNNIKKFKIKRLPESLKPINFNRMRNDCPNVEWG
ncbi:unnamed protein product [Ceratitis capitata]|uniref:(Mediterranean fruit fly) hypothetical protein n=1 Tax=Ceratitis capitata TaxID=7213 RepID=A0A811UNR2_CERCA|nr:unnamed protein product [Ceratitis capitata]